MKTLIGLTGGIGSGKSEVARMFGILGVPIYFADEASKNLLDLNDDLKVKLTDAFGPDIYRNGFIDRKAFASIIFKDEKILGLANSIIHPFVYEDIEMWAAKNERSYLILESAILFESKGESRVNKTVTVYTPTEQRITRVMKRDNCSRDEVLSRMKYQLPDEKKKELADYVIFNDDEHMLIPQVLSIHNQLTLGLIKD